MPPPLPQHRRVRALAAAALAAAAAAAGVLPPATAGVPLVDGDGVPYGWDLDTAQPNVVAGKVTYYLDPSGTADIVSGSRSDLDAVRDGIAAWEVPTTRIRFLEDTSRPASGRNANDRVNWIGWANGVLGPFTFAATFPSRKGGALLDADVVFNDRDFAWDTRTPGLNGVADIHSLAAHEWGHAIGADHVPLRRSTMYFSSDAGTTSFRTPAPDDVALVGSMYPNGAFDTTTGAIEGRVDVAGTSDDRAVHVVAVSVASAEPAASALSGPDGSYTIRGLPAGTYRIVAAPTVPLGDSMNAFWRSGATSFLPAVASDAPGNPAPASVVRVLAGAVAAAPEIRVAAATAPNEPDDSEASATVLAIGEAAAGRFEDDSDVDWYAFDAASGQRVSISVLAWGLGADCDPQIRVFGPDGSLRAGAVDIQSGAAFRFFPEGEDLDARVLGFVCADAGRYAVRVQNETQGSGGRAFHVTFVTVAADGPSPSLSEVFAQPPRLDAGGTATGTVFVRPSREDGVLLGPGAIVTLTHDGAGGVSAAQYVGDGEYAATVTAAADPGRDTFSATVTSSGGITQLAQTTTVVYVGPVDATASAFTAEPRRIAADGAEQARLRFVPRDASGEALGAGRVVTFRDDADLDASVGPALDVGDGVYEAVVTAGTQPGLGVLGAALGTGPALRTTPFGLGFALSDVLAQAAADVETFRATSALPRRVRASLADAASRIAAARTSAGAPAGDARAEKRAVVSARGALAPLDVAFERSKGALTDPGTRTEIARALRQAADAAIARAQIVTGRDQRRFDAASELLAAGDAAFDTGRISKAAARWTKAFTTVFPLLD